ncbi:MAG: tetratricopeptide repeat protein, partial [Caldilineaceae bacterium]
MTDPSHLFKQAAEAFQAGELATAAARMQRLLQMKSDNGHYHYILGEIRRRQGNTTAADASYRQALHLTPTHADAHFRLANLLRSQDQLEQAIRHYNAAITNAPHHQEAYLQLGNLLLEGWQQDAAIAIYQQLLALNPDHAEAHHNLGLALVRAARYAEAVPHLERALALRPGWLTATHMLGIAAGELGQVATAVRAFAPILAGPHGNFALQLHVDTLGAPLADSQEAMDSYLARLHMVLDRKLAAVAEHPALVRALSTTQLYDANAGPPFFLSYYGRDLKPILSQWADLFQPRFAAAQEEPPLAKSGSARPHIGFVVTPGHEGVFLTDRMGLINGLDGQRFQLSIFCATAAQSLIKARLTNAAVTVRPCRPELEP